MKLFENKVGRPSNETLKKRKMFYVGIAASVFLVILLLTLALSSLSTVKLTGAVQTFSENEKVNLPNKTTKYLLKNGKLGVGKLEAREYYVRAVYNEDGFNRVKLSKTEKGIAIYWVNASEVSKASSSSGNTSSTTKPATNYVKGDVNGDGKITDADVLDVGKNIVGLLDFNENEKSAADMDNNGKITATDAKLVQQMIANSISMTEIDGKIYVNDIKDVSVTLTISGDKFKVESLNSSILSIQSTTTNSFKVKALAEGSAKIKVTSNKTEKSVTYEYNVKKNSNSSSLSVTLTPTGTANSEGVIPVDKETDVDNNKNKYANKVDIQNNTGNTVYYRWFTYEAYETSGTPSWNDSGCIEIASNKTDSRTWNISVTSSYPKRSGLVKVYSNKDSCKDDNNANKPNNVLATKSVKYGLKKAYLSASGWKMVWYNHSQLSKKIGTQYYNLCGLAAYSHGAFIISNGKVIGNKKTEYEYFGAVDGNTTSATGIYSLIKTKIDAGIPVVIHVWNNSSSTHWVTVTGYKPGKEAKNMSFSDIYIVDPAYYIGFVKFYDNKTVTLWRGIASDRTGSIKGFHSDYATRTWNKISDVKQP